MSVMDLVAHSASTAKTAIYPGVGLGTTTALSYLTLGLAGEAGEVLDVFSQQASEMPDSDVLRPELGDVLWYGTRLLSELGLDLVAVERSAAAQARSAGPLELVLACSRVCELVKKALRDDSGQVSDLRREALRGALVEVLVTWVGIHTNQGMDPERTAADNVAKLLDRQARSVLAGSGDHR